MATVIIMIKLIRNGMIMIKELLIFFSVIERQRFRLASYQTKFPDIHICHTKSNNYNNAVKIINNCDYDCNNDGNSHNNL